MATPIRLAAAPPARPPQPLSPPPPPPHHDTTLTLSLALPPPPFVCAISPRTVPRPPDGVVARVRSSSLTEDTPPSPCSECGKRFPSWKALFGHMRCHPERQWRGIKKPPHFRHQAVVAPAAAADLQFTEQERETATSLLMLRQGEPGKGKKSILGASPSAKVSCGASTSASSPPPPRCDDHKCSVCARGFATGQALGGHKRCHWEKTTCAEGTTAVATSSGCSASPTSSSQAAPATTLDLNLPPPGMPPLPKKRKRDQGEVLDATLDLKLGF
ncbi:unnamed protein product [Miscanthus lutarioriparius]|uniref:C2H2-type domain-containing protein n=1 Tax=Miscanthus lutarioriparius TaxID=422564 RepID=A0A811PKI2_9POAL|nr:unnamed protein product [Miscanthus lutarioriparius]